MEYFVYENSPVTGFEFLLLTTIPTILVNLVSRGWSWNPCLQGQGIRLRPPCPCPRDREDPESFHK